jgi:hypothetical protein
MAFRRAAVCHVSIPFSIFLLDSLHPRANAESCGEYLSCRFLIGGKN